MSIKRSRPQLSRDAPEDLPPAKYTKYRIPRRLPDEQKKADESTPGSPRTPPSTHSSAIRDTPYRQSSSHPCSIPTQPAYSHQIRRIGETLAPEDSTESVKLAESLNRFGRSADTMEQILRLEIDGAVYEYTKLCHEFFHVDQPHIDKALAELKKSGLLKRDGGCLVNRGVLKTETTESHATWATLLNTIRGAVFKSTEFRPSSEPIVPSLNRRLYADHSDDTNISPDIVQGIAGDKGRRHWGDLEFFAEYKSNPGSLGEALMQIARYSRALLTHQIYRKHIFSLALCGTEATFVWITRTGLIHSPPIDLEKDEDAFLRAAIGLFSLDDSEFGYNTNFYYWPSLKDVADGRDRQLRVRTKNWRWIVVEVLCHRMCLVGRATVVILLRRVGNPQHRAVLKLIWRPDGRTPESTKLEAFKDCHAVCRCRWSESTANTKVLEPGLLRPSSFQYIFVPLTNEDLELVRSVAPPTDSSNSRQHAHLLGSRTRQKIREFSADDFRHYDMLLMDEGVSLWRIKHLVHLLRVLRDAVIGYAAVALKGEVHRDISSGNILCRPPNSPDASDDLWKDTGLDSDLEVGSTTAVDAPPERYNFEDITFLIPEGEITEATRIEDYTTQRYGEQKPLGSLFDFEFMVQESRDASQVGSVADRTGTIAFMSAQILLASSTQPVVHGFLHDLESFFWVFMWFVFTRAKSNPARPLAGDSLAHFDNLYGDHQASGAWKKNILMDIKEIQKVLSPLVKDTDWVEALHLALAFGNLLRKSLYPSVELEDIDLSLRDSSELSPPAKEWTKEDKWGVILGVVQLFDKVILRLQ